MAHTSGRDLTQMARRAGYEVLKMEQLRSNRWLLTLAKPCGTMLLAMVQCRPLIGAADVQDLADLVRLRRAEYGLLIAQGGSFSPFAQQTLAELGSLRLCLCTSLPAAVAETGEVRAIGAIAPS